MSDIRYNGWLHRSGTGGVWQDSSGRVGIGSSVPSYMLQAQTSGTSTTAGGNIVARFQSNAAGRDATIQLSDNVSHSATISMLSSAFIVKQAGAETVRISSAGDVVIGTTAAARSPLHIHRDNADCYVHVTNSTTGTASGDGFTIHQSGVESLLVNRETGNMRLYTAGTERLRITSAGLVGINQTPSTAQLVVKNSDDSNRNSIDIYNDNGNQSTSISQDSTGAGSFLQKNNSGTIKTFIKSYGDSYLTGGNLGIGTDNPAVKLDIVDSGSPNIALRGSSYPSIRYSALDGTTDAEIYYGIGANDLVVNNVNAGLISFKTTNTERLRILSGGGITFNGDTAAANALDDYEEGLYTGTLTCLTSGTITVDSSWDQLAYTKIGRVVYVSGRLRVSAVSSPSGAQLRLNLPVASAASTEDAGRVTGYVYVQGGTKDIKDYTSMPTVGGSAYIQIGFADTNNSTQDVCAAIDSDTLIAVNFHYIT